MVGSLAWRRQLRREFRARRRAISPEEHARLSIDAQRRLTVAPRFNRARRVALYRAFDGEVRTELLEEMARAAGQTVLFARHRDDQPLDFVDPEVWSFGPSGLPIPRGPTSTLEADDVLVVPGVAFTNDGQRLGMGGGHYDRTLSDCPAWSAGLAFECQLADEPLPSDSWDQRVTALYTDQKVYTFDDLELSS